ncbi:MAG: hypothetical protein NVS4B7_13300 [Ktedonobacteraceae bacterium]
MISSATGCKILLSLTSVRVPLHILPVLGKVKLQKLTPQHLQKLYNQKLEEGSAPQSVKHMHHLLHKALNDALKWNLISRKVYDLVDTPRVPKHEIEGIHQRTGSEVP